MKEKLIKLIGNKRMLIALIGAVGVVFIAISYLPQGKDEKKELVESNEYIAETEQRLTEMIASVEGAGKVKVMLTLSSDSAKVYKESSKTDNQKSEETVVIISGAGGNEALVEKTLTPEVKGVVVVCEGGDKGKVKADIITMVSALLGIGPNRVCVCKLNSER